MTTRRQSKTRRGKSSMTRMADITVVLDRSGSMQARRGQAIESFNLFIGEQQAVGESARMSLVQFDHEYQRVYQERKMKNASFLDQRSYVPRGTTALLDAIGITIIETQERLKAQAARYRKVGKSRRPVDVVIAIITDGLENSSKEFTQENIHRMIRTHEDEYSWRFLFMGTSHESVVHGMRFGVDRKRVLEMGDSEDSYAHAQTLFSMKVCQMRGNGTMKDLDFKA